MFLKPDFNLKNIYEIDLKLLKKLGIKGTIRVSLALYNDFEDIDKLIVALKKALSMLKG